MKDQTIQNVLLGAFTFTMGLVVFKIISKHLGAGESAMASLGTSNGNETSEEVAGAMIGTGAGSGCRVNIGGNYVTYPCGSSSNMNGDNIQTDCNAQGSFGCTVNINGMVVGGTPTGGRPLAPVRRSFF